jgi:hypothetical protein
MCYENRTCLRANDSVGSFFNTDLITLPRVSAAGQSAGTNRGRPACRNRAGPVPYNRLLMRRRAGPRHRRVRIITL